MKALYVEASEQRDAIRKWTILWGSWVCERRFLFLSRSSAQYLSYIYFYSWILVCILNWNQQKHIKLLKKFDKLLGKNNEQYRKGHFYTWIHQHRFWADCLNVQEYFWRYLLLYRKVLRLYINFMAIRSYKFKYTYLLYACFICCFKVMEQLHSTLTK